MSSLGSPSTFFLAKKKAYEVERSLRFNDDDSPYLSRTPSSAGNRRTYTISVWAKIIDNGTYRAIIGAGGGTSRDRLQIFNDDKLVFNLNDGSGGDLRTTQLLRDPSAWYHIVVGVDTTQSTASDRIKLYLNGSQVTSFSTENYPSQNYDCKLNNNIETFIGQSSSNNFYFDGYLAEFNFIDGSQLTPSSFAETDVLTGEYKPKKYTGGYGTNGFYLNFSDNSGTTATTLGKDYSGNGNNFTPNNFSVAAGKDDDSSFDSPTNNFPTLSPVDKSLVGTMSNGNLRISYNYKPASKTFRATMALPSTGKIYWEWENEEASSNPGRWATGLVRYTNEAGVVDVQGYNDADYLSVSYGGSTWNGTTQLNPPGSGWPQDGSFSFYSGERVAFAVDCSNGKVWLGKVASNGSTTWYANDGGTDGDPAGGTNESCTLPSFTTATEWMPVVIWHDGGGASSTTFTSNINFGNHSFLGTVPNGFKKLCSANLPDPSIKLPDKHFDTLLWTGNNTDNRAITGLNFQPDFTWIKRRSGGGMSHFVVDALRSYTDSSGNGNVGPLATNDTYAESNALTDGGFESFNSDGFTLGKGSSTANAAAPYQRNNASSETYVGWNWKAGGSASSNSDGTITSSVSVNASAGFSIVTFSGSGNRTIGHGLGVAPKVIIMKGLNVSDQWTVGHEHLEASNSWHKGIPLNTSASTQDNSGFWNDTAPTSTVFSKGTWNDGYNMVAYCFSEVKNYSKFGSYRGNQNTKGSFIYTGFEPALVITKGTWGGNWNMYDNSRNPYNVANKTLYPNLSNAESTENSSGNQMDLLSNGFKLRGSNNDTNHAADFIYLAFAESPFKYARAR